MSLPHLLFFTPISSRACFSLPGNYLREAGPPLQILQCTMRTNTRVWTHPFQIQLWVSIYSQFLIQCDLAQECLGHNLFIMALNLCQITVSTAHHITQPEHRGLEVNKSRRGLGRWPCKQSHLQLSLTSSTTCSIGRMHTVYGQTDPSELPCGVAVCWILRPYYNHYSTRHVGDIT